MLNRKRLKLVCLFLFAIASLICAVSDERLIHRATASTSQLQNGFTGAPGEPTCANIGCHSGALNPGLGEFRITGLPEVYSAGEAYTITITTSTTDENRKRWGFQLTVLNEAERGVGTLQNLDDTISVLSGSGPTQDREYVQHTETSTFNEERDASRVSWTFRWTAPSSASGPVTFYLAGVQANGNDTSTGDLVYTTSLRLLSEPPEAPVITELKKEGKFLIVIGRNFDDGSKIYVNGERYKKTVFDPTFPDMLAGKKLANKLVDGDIITVKNSAGLESNAMPYVKPSD